MISGFAILLATKTAFSQATNEHPCLSALTPVSYIIEQQPNNTNTTGGNKGWYPLGLLIEPLIGMGLNEKRRSLTARWLAEHADQEANESFALYNKKNAKPDRYDRIGLLPIKTKDDRSHSLQEDLLKEGLARVDVSKLSNQCATHLLSIEQKARDENRGLWGEIRYEVQNANSLHLSDKISTYQLISGTALSISRNPKKISYLNFGTYWKEDFTVTLTARSLKIWEQQGHSLDELKGQTVYVRGWIENRDGALVRIKHPQQLQYTIKDPLSEAQ